MKHKSDEFIKAIRDQLKIVAIHYNEDSILNISDEKYELEKLEYLILEKKVDKLIRE